MRSLFFLFLVGSLFVCSPAFAGDAPQVLQPNATAYSADELAVLLPAVERLEALLGDTRLGSRRYFASNDWQSGDFARYTAGTLVESGYEARLVSGAGWPDGVHVWVLVGVPVDTRTAWIPVEACPEPGHSQQTLGQIPIETDSEGVSTFESTYLRFSDSAALPENLPPVAKVRAAFPGPIAAGTKATFIAAQSYDPDGTIELYTWDFGERRPLVTTAAVAMWTFEKPGVYAVTLTVRDAFGRSAATTASIEVVAPAEGPQEEKSIKGCGCGK